MGPNVRYGSLAPETDLRWPPIKRHERPLLTTDFGAYVRVDEDDADLVGLAELFRALRFLDDVGRRISNGHFWVEECPFRAACVHPASCCRAIARRSRFAGSPQR